MSKLVSKIFLASGNWTAPPGVTSVFLTGYGGGGAGGGGAGSGTAAYKPPIGGGGGGASLMSTVIVSVVPGSQYSITIGVGGNPGGSGGTINGAGTNGSPGGSTIFVSPAPATLATFQGASGGMGGAVGAHAYGDGGGLDGNNYGLAAGGTPTTTTALTSHTFHDWNIRLGSGPGCGGDGTAYIAAASMGNPTIPRAGNYSIEGYYGGAAGATGGVTGDENFTPGGAGGGGAAGPGGNGGAAGSGGNNTIGGTGAAGTAGSDAAANTGGGGGGGGASGTGSVTGRAGLAGGLGGSGKLTITWIE